MIGELQDRPVPALVRKPVIDLVGDDHRPPLPAQRGDATQAIGSEHGPGRVAGRVDQDGFRPGTDAPGHGVGSQLKPVMARDPDGGRNASGIADEVRIAGVIRIRQHDLVAGVEKMAEQEQHGGRGAGRDEDALGRDVDTVRHAVVLGDRLAKREDAQAVGVLGAAILQSLLRCVSDDSGRFEVGLAELQVNHVDAPPLEVFCPLAHLDGEEWLDQRAARRHHPVFPKRLRARRICHIMRGPSRRTLDLLPG